MTVRSAWLLPGGTGDGQTREDTRLTPVGTMLPDSELATRTGVIPGGAPFAATAAGAMSLQIGVGRGAVQGTATQGAYPVAVVAPETVDFADGDAVLDRIDTVVVHVYDGLYDTSGETLAVVEVIPGTPAGAPVAPSLPPACLPLWDVRVRAGASAGVGGIDWSTALTDRRRYTAAVGAVVPRAVASDVGAYDGQYSDIDGTLMRWSASADRWVTYRAPLDVVTATGVAVAIPAGGWVLQNAQGIKANGMITLRVQLERTGGDYGPATSEGNLVDLGMFTVPAAWRPNKAFGSERLPAVVSDMYGDGAGTLQANTGQFVVVSWTPGARMIQGRISRVMLTYPA